MSDIDFTNMKEIFIDDTLENIEIITDKILASELDKKISDDDINNLMRLCHSIKGAARMLKLSSIAQTFHDLETILKNVREKRMPYEKFVVDLFLEGMDTVKTALELMRQDINTTEFFDVDFFNRKLDIVANADDEGESSSVEVEQPAEESTSEEYIEEQGQTEEYAAEETYNEEYSQPAEEVQSSDSALDFDLDAMLSNAAAEAEQNTAFEPEPTSIPEITLPPVKEPVEQFTYEGIEEDILADFISESSELIENLANEFVEIEEDCSPQMVDKIFRGMHTLKGGAGFVSLTKFQELAHTCENLLDDVRTGKYKITSAIINELLRANDIFSLYMNMLNNRQPLNINIGENLARLKALKEAKGTLMVAGASSSTVKQTTVKPAVAAKPVVKPAVAVKPTVVAKPAPAAKSAVAPKPVPAQTPKPAVVKPAPVQTKPAVSQPVSAKPQPAAVKPAVAKSAPAVVKPVPQPKPGALIVKTQPISDTPDPVSTELTQQENIAAKIEQKVAEISKPVKPEKDDDKKEKEGQLTQQTLRVELSKLDKLMNLVGELVINKIGFSSQLEKISIYIDEIESNLHHINLHLDNADLKTSLDVYENFQRELSNILNKTKQLQEMNELRNLVKDSSLLFGEENIINKLYENWKTMVVEYQQISNYYIELYKSSTLLATKIGLLAKDLQENVMQTRMLPISTVFTKYKRTVRDLSQKIKKDVRLEISGEETEMDKNIIEKIGDPLTHIVRNSIDHGIENPEERLMSGKAKTGTIKLNAYNKGGSVFIEVEDDGKGIDANKICQKAVEKGILNQERADMMTEHEKLNLIFLAGFSTAEKVTEISGRGVGMDVVRENITKLKGLIDISTKVGQGTKLTIKLPLTLAILQVLQIKEDNNIFAIPANNILEVFSIKLEQLEKIKNIYMLNNRGKYIPVYFMTDILNLPSAPMNEEKDINIVVVGFGDNNIGLIVSEIVKKEEVVIKNLGDIIKKVQFVSGATIEGDGTITIILNVPEIIDHISAGGISTSRISSSSDSSGKNQSSQMKRVKASGSDEHLRVLVVEDSTTTRKMLRSIMESGGYEVVEGTDGIDGLEKLRTSGPFNLMTVDVNMPRMNGYGLTQEVRKLLDFKNLPIIMITTRDLEVDKIKGFESGVDDYIVKPFEPAELLTVVGQYIKTGRKK